MATRFNLARIGATILGASMALLATALPASAETHAHVDASADVRGLPVNIQKANHRQSVPTTLIGLRVDGGDKAITTYCVELSVSTKNGAAMREVPWNAYPDSGSPFFANAGKVNWILQNSYPNVTPEDLGKKVGAPDGKGVSKETAIAATQAAIWHFSDNAELDANKPIPDDAHAPAEQVAAVKAIYTYLTGPANVGIKDEPQPSLQLTPSERTGKAGDKIGPFTLETTADRVTMDGNRPSGVELVDQQGNPVKELKNGSQVFVKVPADAKPGSATFGANATANLEKGRLFVGDNVKTQSLIVAQPVRVSLHAVATAKWTGAPATVPSTTTHTTTPAPTTSQVAAPTTTSTPAVVPAANSGGLAYTGASVIGLVVAGIVLLGAGVGALLLQRRRNRA